jgi:hypothetical protein
MMTRRILIALVCLCLLPRVGEAAISLVDVGTPDSTVGATVSVVNLTVSGSDTVLYCFAAIDDTSDLSTSTATWDSDGANEALTFVSDFQTGRSIGVWRLVNPTAATNDAVDFASLPGAAQKRVNCLSFSGVDGGDPDDAVQTGSGADSCTVTVTSPAGDWIVGGASIDGGAATHTIDTASGNVSDNVSEGQVDLHLGHDPDGANDDLVFDWTNTVSSGCLGFNVNAAAASTTGRPGVIGGGIF